MHLWSQTLSLGLAIVGFTLALVPRRSATPDFGAAVSETIIHPAKRLLRFPIFWGGAVLLAYVTMQGCNPAWRFASNPNIWWLEPVAHVSWLPSGIDAPIAKSNAWRALIIYASLWLTVCSVWTGLLRRKSYRVLLLVLAANASALALLGVLQLAGGSHLIFWSYEPSNDRFVSSFIYPNHGGAYFNLMVAIAAGFSWWHHGRAERDSSSPFLMGFLAAAGVGAASIVILSYSRMSTALLMAFLLVAGSVAIVALMRAKKPARKRATLIPFLLAAAGVIAIGFFSLGTKRGQERFASLLFNPSPIVDGRAEARAATRDMIADHWLFGWGAGTFRYAFPKYSKKYPDLNYTASGDRRYWEHAHDDLLEFPAELGVVGLLPLAFGLGYLAWGLVRVRFWRNPLSLVLVIGCGLTLVHAWVDFVFQNPAVLLTWCILLIGALRWAELDQAAVHRRLPSLSRRLEGKECNDRVTSRQTPVARRD